VILALTIAQELPRLYISKQTGARDWFFRLSVHTIAMLPSRAPLVALPDNDNVEAWRALLTDYYTQNAPDKLHMVGDKMLAKFAGRYGELYGNRE
jgi:hypothetical protein